MSRLTRLDPDAPLTTVYLWAIEKLLATQERLSKLDAMMGVNSINVSHVKLAFPNPAQELAIVRSELERVTPQFSAPDLEDALDAFTLRIDRSTFHPAYSRASSELTVTIEQLRIIHQMAEGNGNA